MRPYIRIGTINFTVLFILIFAGGCFHTPTGSTSPVSAGHYDTFAMIWEDYEANYPEFTLKNIDWKESFARYSPIAEQVQTTGDLIYHVLLPMLSELKDVHIWFTKPGGQQLSSFDIEIEPNYSLPVLLDHYLEPAGFTGWSGYVGCCDPQLLPYISIDHWQLDMNLGRIEDFLESVADLPGIIIDVRMNPGGNNTLCPEVAGHFTETTELAYFKRYRTGPGYDDVCNLPVTTIPDSKLRYTGTVYLLIGECSASSTEDFVLHMMNLDNVVLIGDTTMGALCAPTPVSLMDGWSVNTINWSSRDSSKEPLEGIGIPPDIYVEATEEDFAQGIDPVLEYAIELLECRH